MTTEEREHQIQEIMNQFDFKKVYLAMTALEWQWVRGIPSVEELRVTARKLLEDLSIKSDCLATGGFMAYWNRKGKKLGLSFVVEWWEIED